jgi:hypothetical protein
MLLDAAMFELQEIKKEPLVWPSVQDWWEALRWVLLVLTLMMALTLIGSFVSYEGVVAHGHPWLPHRVCPGCPFCGMTRSFCAMSSGHFAQALRWNRAGPGLYLAFWLWTLCASCVGLRLIFNRLKLRRQPSLQVSA